MSAKLNETIQDIALKHGVVLGKDDPILILQTMNEKLFKDNYKAQQEMLAQFKEEMEHISSQWKIDAREKAEKVLNIALASCKEAMAKLMQESTKESAQAMKKMLSDSLVEAQNMMLQARKFSRFAFCSSIAILTGFVLTFLVHFFR